jgi:hypothetical protein
MMHLGWFVGRGFSVHGWKQDWWGDDFRDWQAPISISTSLGLWTAPASTM